MKARLTSGFLAEPLGQSLRQLALVAWALIANFALASTLYATRDTGLLQWALDAESLDPGFSASALLIGGGVAFGSVVAALTERLAKGLVPTRQRALWIGLGAWTSFFIVIPFAYRWLAEDAGYESYASTWFFIGWAITQFAAAWLLVDSEGDDAAMSPA